MSTQTTHRSERNDNPVPPIGAQAYAEKLARYRAKLNPPKYKTTAIYLSGAFCGKIWLPPVDSRLQIEKTARGPFGFWNKGDTFREALLSLIRREGGDFQTANFTEDTVIRIERRSINGANHYSVHVWKRTIGQLPDCADLVTEGAFSNDYSGEE